MSGLIKIFENGEEYTTINGKKEGEYKLHGKKCVEQLLHYKNDLLEGEGKEWFTNGKLHVVYYYKEGKQNGTSIEYWPSGILRYRANYQDDKLHGTAFEYNREGKLIDENTYENGEAEKGIEHESESEEEEKEGERINRKMKEMTLKNKNIATKKNTLSR